MGSSGDDAADAGLHLVSWNTAGWGATLERIRGFRGGLNEFLQRHHVDVLCLQEVKTTAKALAAEGGKLEGEMKGYESFWSCNEGAAGQQKGFNGVATLAREGAVLRADCCPLRDPELDGEARCLMTDHGHFVLFNAYVPQSSGGARLPFKLRWLTALRAAMARERAAGRPVVLAGDLNMRLSGRDAQPLQPCVDARAWRWLESKSTRGSPGRPKRLRASMVSLSSPTSASDCTPCLPNSSRR